MKYPISCLFNPKTVAVLGASNNPSKWGSWIMEDLLQSQNPIRIFPINPNEKDVWSRPALSSVRQVSGPIDVAIVAVPTVAFEKAVDELLEHGTKVIIGISTGFAEYSPEGFDLEKRITQKIRDAGSIFIGPNCAGVWNSKGVHCLPVGTFGAGNVALISQSGGIVTDVYLRLKEHGQGFSKAISIGNLADDSIMTPLLEYLDNDPDTKVIMICLENTHSLPCLNKIKKPVYAYQPKTNIASIRAVLKHTYSTLAYDCGWDSIRDVIHQVIMELSDQKNFANNRMCVLTDSGGLGAIAAGEAFEAGFTLDMPSYRLKEQLREAVSLSLPRMLYNNPLDMVGVFGGFSKTTVKILEVLQNSDEIDCILMILCLIETDLPDEVEINAANLISKVIVNGGKTTVIVCKDLTTPAVRILQSENIPVYRDIETAVEVLRNKNVAN